MSRVGIGVIIQNVRTGRRFGDKLATRTGVASVGSAKIQFLEFDHWDGPVEPGELGEYIRATQITGLGRMEWP